MLAASRILNLSQPAISSAIAELEKNIDTSLFDRFKKKMVLNEKGRLMIPMIRLLLSNARDLNQMFETDSDQLGGVINIGASRTLASYIMPDILHEFSVMHPHVKIDVQCRNKSQIIQQMEDFSLDIGVIAGTCNKPFIQNLPWLTDELCVFSANSHPLAKKELITINDLSKSNWVLREEGSGTLELFLNALPADIKPLKTIMEFNSLEPIKRLVEKGTVLSCVSRKAIKREAAAGLLKELPTPCLDLRRHYFFLIHQKRRESPLLSIFLNYLLSLRQEFRG